MVLEEDPDLGADLSPDELAQARLHSVARVVEIDVGGWDPDPIVTGSQPEWQGLLMLEGLMVRRVCVGRRAACELFGPGDLFRPWDADGQYEPLPITLEWIVPRPTRLAVLDSTYALRMARWPAVTSRLLARLGFRARNLALIQAVTHLPRIHARLLVLFWLLADRWGRVGPDGVRVILPLTHETLSMLVGGNRPTVTVALGKLTEADLLRREGRERWLLTRRAVELLCEPESVAMIDDVVDLSA